jgi:site-specific DNA-methyltransferase (adenine-specific)
LSFGSKISGGEAARQELFSVKKILAPELLVLNNDLLVRLIGVKSKAETSGAAMEFLLEKIAKHRVFMKYDAQKYDAENRLLCYLYLDNKTFVNAHLLRSGLVALDLSFDYHYKNKFWEALENGKKV